ncbi:hypothetical protein LQZ18_16255 [Lachnospiraceae bacterium ZAX-1]
MHQNKMKSLGSSSGDETKIRSRRRYFAGSHLLREKTGNEMVLALLMKATA